MKAGIIEESMRGVNMLLIAKALSASEIFVTHESLNPECKRKSLTFNVCIHFRVPYADNFLF
ncbi:DUF4411 family protein [Tatumella ptyseos]|uniref:DUF4411 family protein n=1 Tax=Tatumella ptyseos TaxID=82987 RepID=UPI003C6F435A